MFSHRDIINLALPGSAQFRGQADVFITPANQLLGTYSKLSSFRGLYRSAAGKLDYTGWEVHHIVEHQDLDRLGIAKHFPPYKDQLCVLLPRSAHVDRINNILRNRNPTKLSASPQDLLSAYREAYELMGDYCGGGAIPIRRELMAVVTATFRAAKAL